MARLEPEVLDAELRAWGCPYPAEDYRCQIWLTGYQAGVKAGGVVAARVINERAYERQRKERGL